MFAFPVPLFALTPGAGFLIGSRDRIDAGADDGPRGLGGAADNGAGRAHNGPHEAALQHQADAEDADDGRTGFDGLDHDALLPAAQG